MGGVDLDRAAGELYCPTCETTFASGERCAQDNTRLVRIAKSADQLIGRELDGRYTIVEKLGQGGMGTVYRGTQHSVGREVAIKVVTPSLVAEGVVIKRFLREAKLASRLSHPNAVAVLDFGQTDDGLFYLVMELVIGRTLDKVLETEGALSPQRLVRIGSQICDALEGAHQMNVVHRDLKPANVMVMTTGRDLVKVLDFGLAKSLTPDIGSSTMTNAGALLGTPAFMPPELVTGQNCDSRADLYSLGCLLHYAASGKLPFVAGSLHELIAMHASEPPPPLDNLPAPIARVITRLLEKEPARRFQTAAATREALEAALGGSALSDVQPLLDLDLSRTGPPTVLGWTGTIPTPVKRATPATGSAVTTDPHRPTPSTGSLRPLAPFTVRPPILGTKRVITPVHGSVPLDPAEAELMASSPTLPAITDEIVAPFPATPIPHAIPPTPFPSTSSLHASRPTRSPTGMLQTENPTARDLIAPGDRKRLPVLLAVGAIVLAVGALVAFSVVRGSRPDKPATPTAATPTPTPTPTALSPIPTPSPTPSASPSPSPNMTPPVAKASPMPPVAKPSTKPASTKPASTKPEVAKTTTPTPAVTKPSVTHPPQLPTGPIRVNPGAF